jgi:hypothetical protein
MVCYKRSLDKRISAVTVRIHVKTIRKIFSLIPQPREASNLGKQTVTAKRYDLNKSTG